MIFITFFGCCFAIALAAAAMSTKFWLEAEAIQRRINPDKTLEVRPNSTGHVNFGLFKGRKSLNVGFGTRLHHFDTDVCRAVLWLQCGMVAYRAGSSASLCGGDGYDCHVDDISSVRGFG
ncbi:hypothetical protein E2C01_049922 [Portunus trituberculatus]|uniref:Secreted protein n=1 Tax=Portunus trituberculatus TaxID=210409 RepID=A0A5B7GHE8_PORTR|nr:hypothetical protein [Portunus trituberculatus]